jgi:RNA polymerase sigma-70 factor (ECF subfamily)
MSTTEFNYLVVEHSDLLRPFALSLTGNSELAKDLYQETMYKAIANREKYTVGTNIKAWLYTIMRNIFINDYRRMKKRNVVSGDLSNDYLKPDAPFLALNNPESNIVVKDIEKRITRMPEIFKRPFNLYFEGYRYQEIAIAMNEPLGTIKSRIHFARKLLKEQIERN